MIRIRIALAAACPALADFDAGQAAFDAGRFDEAVAGWRDGAGSRAWGGGRMGGPCRRNLPRLPALPRDGGGPGGEFHDGVSVFGGEALR